MQMNSSKLSINDQNPNLETNNNAKLRIGIDVGGTFTHGVLINVAGEILRNAIVLTTHRAEIGIALGIGQVVNQLLEDIDPLLISMVAHSTTQATNAVLEGDLVPIKMFVLAPANQMWLTKLTLKSPFIISEHKLNSSIEYINPQSKLNYSSLDLPYNLAVVLQTFSDKSNDFEHDFATNLRAFVSQSNISVEVIEASAITRLLGLRIRAATAALNAAMLPKIRAVSNATVDIISQPLPDVPINILTSDGGSMPVSDLASRPLAALLSGPAAGAAAATIFSGLTDAVFLEVGGTSTDISCIRNGRIELKPAQLGDAMIHLRTLDLNTIALGGGSLVNVNRSCGPRSAHIAGWNYLSFAKPSTTLSKSAWIDVKGSRYLALYDTENNIFGLTLTDIINWLNKPDRLSRFAKLAQIPDDRLQAIDFRLIPETDSAFCNPDDVALNRGVGLAVEMLAQQFKPDVDQTIGWVHKLLTATFNPICALLKRILADHEMNRLPGVWLAGGGGGAYVVLPLISLMLNLPFRVVPFARVISAVGAAVALDTAVHEVNVFKPTEETFASVRAIVANELQTRGILADSCEFRFEYDSRANLLRCSGTGAKPALSTNKALFVYNEEDAARILNTPNPTSVVIRSELGALYSASVKRKNWLGAAISVPVILLVDSAGRPRLNLPEAKFIEVVQQNPVAVLASVLDENTTFGDAGAVAPALWFWDGKHLHDFSTAGDSAATLALIRATVSNNTNSGWILVKQRL